MGTVMFSFDNAMSVTNQQPDEANVAYLTGYHILHAKRRQCKVLHMMMAAYPVPRCHGQPRQ
jgi:hypothetical protein